jgi:adenylate cyclase
MLVGLNAGWSECLSMMKFSWLRVSSLLSLPRRLGQRRWWQSCQRPLWRWRGVLMAVPTTSAIVLGLRGLGLLQGMELDLLDCYFQGQPSVRDGRIVIVELRESDLQKYGWPIADQTLADVLTKIKAQQPRVIGLDLYRDLPVRQGHKALQTVFQTTPNLVGIKKIGGRTDRTSIAPPPALAKLDQVAANDILVDGDGKLRRGLLFLADRNNDNIPTLATTAAVMYLAELGIEPEMPDATTIKLGAQPLTLFDRDQGGYVRADDSGYQMLLNQRIQPDSFQRLSIDQVLRGQGGKNWGRDRIVLIGPAAESLNDLFYSASSHQGWFQPLRRIPGIDLHAQLTSQLLSTALNRQAALQTLPDWAEALVIGGGAIVGATVVWRWRYDGERAGQKHRRWRVLIPSLCFGIASVGLVAGSYGLFLWHWWLPIVPTMLAMGGGGLLVTTYQAQKSNELRKTLGRYLTDDVVADLLENPAGITLNGETRKVTTLISDIRGFTSLSEQYPATKIVEMLNLYLAIMTAVIQSYGGTINDLTGDGMIIFFGAPLNRSDDTERAVACALAMQQAMGRVNQQNEALGFPQLEMGIGINTGEVVVGNIGSDAYMKYTAIGSHINLAARVESFTVGGQVLISAGTFADVADQVAVVGEMQAQMKGVAKPVTLYDVTGISGAYAIQLVNLITATAQPLAVPLPIVYGILDGKHVGEGRFVATIVSLSDNGAELRSAQIPAALSNLKLAILPPGAVAIGPDGAGPELAGLELAELELAEIYAKVMGHSPAGQTAGQFWIRFTMIPPATLSMLRGLIDV